MSERRSQLARGGGCDISLLGRFAVCVDGEPLSMSADAERLVAFLVLQVGTVSRAYVAGSLWGEGPQDRAFGNLRSALWRVRRNADQLIIADGQTLSIAATAAIDLRRVRSAARALEEPTRDEPLPDVALFTTELLPGWYDEWAVFERERHRQRALHSLEALSTKLAERQCYGLAIQAALSAIEIDPLRESSRRQLIGVHRAEGNFSEALRAYHQFRALLHRELSIEPTDELKSMVEVTPSRP